MRLLRLGEQVVGEPLSRAADGIDVHAVVARADHPAQPRGSKGEVAVKTVEDFGVPPLDRPKLRGQVGVLEGRGQPALIQLVMVHITSSRHIYTFMGIVHFPVIMIPVQAVKVNRLLGRNGSVRKNSPETPPGSCIGRTGMLYWAKISAWGSSLRAFRRVASQHNGLTAWLA